MEIMSEPLTEEQIEELRQQMGIGRETPDKGMITIRSLDGKESRMISAKYISCEYISYDKIWEACGMQAPEH